MPRRGAPRFVVVCHNVTMVYDCLPQAALGIERWRPRSRCSAGPSLTKIFDNNENPWCYEVVSCDVSMLACVERAVRPRPPNHGRLRALDPQSRNLACRLAFIERPTCQAR